MLDACVRVQFPSVKEYWDDAGYSALLMVNIIVSLVQYYATISAAYQMGEARYFRDTRRRRTTQTTLFGAIRSGS